MRPIPAQMLKQTVTVKVPAEIDSRQATVTETEIEVTRCCLQRASTTARSNRDASLTKTALLFVDAQLSRPQLDWMGLKAEADAAGGDIVILCDGVRYVATSVQEYMDNHARVHHWEVALV